MLLLDIMCSRNFTDKSSSRRRRSPAKHGSKSGDGGPSPSNIFPEKLHDMLEYADEMGYQSMISWANQGTSFVVYDRKKLIQTLLPMFFVGQTKYQSFERQLSLWAFERNVADAPTDGGATSQQQQQQQRSTSTHQPIWFHHPYFVRGQKGLIAKHNLCRESFRQRGSAGSPVPSPALSSSSPSQSRSAIKRKKYARGPTASSRASSVEAKTETKEDHQVISQLRSNDWYKNTGVARRSIDATIDRRHMLQASNTTAATVAVPVPSPSSAIHVGGLLPRIHPGIQAQATAAGFPTMATMPTASTSELPSASSVVAMLPTIANSGQQVPPQVAGSNNDDAGTFIDTTIAPAPALSSIGMNVAQVQPQEEQKRQQRQQRQRQQQDATSTTGNSPPTAAELVAITESLEEFEGRPFYSVE